MHLYRMDPAILCYLNGEKLVIEVLQYKEIPSYVYYENNHVYKDLVKYFRLKVY